ncbi:MAG: hypothetical protein ACOYB7_10630 [Mycobacterium sp.]|jgi:hypothetical protein
MTHARTKGVALTGAVIAAALVVGSPAAGNAEAHGLSTPSGEAVGRVGLDNPAPLMRIAQAIGDRIFNQSTPFNQALDNSELGAGYHSAFGTPNYEAPTHGHNGIFVGILNLPGVKVDYDNAQAAGWSLPAERDLPGTVIRALSGVPVTETTHNGPAVAAKRTSARPGASLSAATVRASVRTLNSR